MSNLVFEVVLVLVLESKVLSYYYKFQSLNKEKRRPTYWTKKSPQIKVSYLKAHSHLWGNTKVEVRNFYMKPASSFAHVLTLHLECSVEIFCPVKLDIVKSFLKSTHSCETFWTPFLLKRRRNLNCVGLAS